MLSFTDTIDIKGMPEGMEKNALTAYTAENFNIHLQQLRDSSGYLAGLDTIIHENPTILFSTMITNEKKEVINFTDRLEFFDYMSDRCYVIIAESNAEDGKNYTFKKR